MGTAAIASDPICRLAHDPEVPSAKRSLAADECDVLLKHATEPVTKPVSGPLPSAPMTNPHAPACSRAELDARYAGGGDGGQTFYGLIVIWNSGAQACLLSGSARISATYADGAVDARVVVNGAPKVVDAYLPADAAAYDDMTGPASGRYLQALLAAPEFDAEPTCPQLSGPAAFTLSIGGLAFTVVNRDDDARQNKILRGCQGDILLEGFGQPSA